MRDMKRRRRTTLLKAESVRPKREGKVRRAVLRDHVRGLNIVWKLTGQEAVELHQQFQVGIVGLWRLSVSRPDVVMVEIDTYIIESHIVSL